MFVCVLRTLTVDNAEHRQRMVATKAHTPGTKLRIKLRTGAYVRWWISPFHCLG